MTTGDLLLRAIRSDSDEDTPRLAYADWLEEQGQPELAEFVRLQCELAKHGPPHKRPFYPEQPTAITKHGDRHYSFTGYVDDGFRVGDRIDLLVHRPLKTPKTFYGFRVYRITPVTGEDAIPGELDVFARMDGDSGRWSGEALAKRELDLFAARGASWFAPNARPTPPNGREFRSGGTFLVVSRGFPGEVFCRSAAWFGSGDRLAGDHPIQSVTLTDTPTFGTVDEGDGYLVGGFANIRYPLADIEDEADRIRGHESVRLHQFPDTAYLTVATFSLRWPSVRRWRVHPSDTFVAVQPVSAGRTVYADPDGTVSPS